MTADEIFRRAKALGIDTPNAMQQRMASVALPARLLLQAPTGSGKTFAYACALLRTLDADRAGHCVQAVVLVPSRELAIQSGEVLRRLAAPEFKTAVFYGGHSMATEQQSLQGGIPDIIVATPGRLLDHLQRGGLSLHEVRTLVLDEYDKSLELGFQAQMRSLMGRMRKVSTLILTSATGASDLPDFIDGIGMTTLDYGADSDTAAPHLTIRRLASPSADKLDTLELLLRSLGDGRAIVFVNHREAAERVYKALRKSGIADGIYHGGMEQDDRDRAVVLFDNGTTPVLVCTDLASRGLDISDVDAVVHYHLPVSAEAWTHRNGRSGRQGAKGNVYVITSDADKIPPYVVWDSDFRLPDMVPAPALPRFITLYFNAGRKEKLSKGDIAGFLMQKGGLQRDQLGKIALRDHCAYAAVDADRARAAIEACAPFKVKNRRVRITQIKSADKK